jgi:hypothetical protein
MMGLLYFHKPFAFIYFYARSHANRMTCYAFIAHVISSPCYLQRHLCSVIVKKLIFAVEYDMKKTQDNNDYNYIYSTSYSKLNILHQNT